MAICPLTNRCRFFALNMGETPEAAEKVRQFYCHNHFQRCARFVFHRMTETRPPNDLLPNSLEEVSKMFGWGLKDC